MRFLINCGVGRNRLLNCFVTSATRLLLSRVLRVFMIRTIAASTLHTSK